MHGQATYDQSFNSNVRGVRSKLRSGGYRDQAQYSRSTERNMQEAAAKYGDQDDVIDDAYIVAQQETIALDIEGINRRMSTRQASDLENETWDAMADPIEQARKGTVQAPFTMDYTITNPNAIVVDPAWAAHRAQQQILSLTHLRAHET